MHRRSLTRLSTNIFCDTKNDEGEDSRPHFNSIWHQATRKFCTRPGTYLLIPCVAALVGWFTNYLAVQMIFYPVKYWGLPIRRWDEVPLGLIGWQGIVPCKTKPMTIAMVSMVTEQLLTVKEAFARLNPNEVANLLAPELPKLTREIIQDLVPMKWIQGLPIAIYRGMDATSQGILQVFSLQFLKQLTKSMQSNIDQIFDLQNCVVEQMMLDRSKLGQLFQKCGQRELDFLTNSGLWFGFLLGIIQMVVALFWENPWTLSIGGAIVGTATNWLALKWIFEPVNPTKIGPFTLQGQFLRRQKEVSAEFSSFFANKILTSEKLWASVLNDPTTQPAFHELFASQFETFLRKVTSGFRFLVLKPETIQLATSKALEKLPNHVPVLYDYMDKTLGLERSLRERMEKMSSVQFERVLHPIFEEDELTLILAGAVLGFLAGLVQQGIETGDIRWPRSILSILSPFNHFIQTLLKGLNRIALGTVPVVQKVNFRIRRILSSKPRDRGS